MADCKIFISYSHADEWLKDELIKHFAALKRNKIISLWHDRMIPAGKIIDKEIDDKIHESNLFLFLISADFINSEYCFSIEYQKVLERHSRGEAALVPIIVRECDWDVGGLRSFAALPPDAIPVTKNAGSKADAQERDPAWTKVIVGLKAVIADLKKKFEAPRLTHAYVSDLFVVDFIRHSEVDRFDETQIFVDPDLYFQNKKEQISSFGRLLDICLSERAVVISGQDRSGKTLIAKMLQVSIDESGLPAIFISGNEIKNSDIIHCLKGAAVRQYGGVDYPLSKMKVIIDDFDECALKDTLKEEIIRTLCASVEGCIIISFSNAPAVLFTSVDLPDPATMVINPVTDSKVYDIVSKWLSIGSDNRNLNDENVLTIFEKIQNIFGQTELQKHPYTVVTFLELLQNSNGSDLAFSSFAACYDTLISTRLINAGVSWNSHDESKNFLSLIAYRCYANGESASLDENSFAECIKLFEEQFLSSGETLRRISKHFLSFENGVYKFHEEYLWFFLCARYVVRVLKQNESDKYLEFVATCTTNIFLKKYANVVIYIAYFDTDPTVIYSLLNILDRLFSKADNWLLSDDMRELMMGLMAKDQISIQANADVGEHRSQLLQEKIADILENAEKVVAHYTLPFLKVDIGDSGHIDSIDRNEIDGDSYMRSVNALLRIHSVIGQILGGRSGTYGSHLMFDCITRMVKASGRYASLNHAIATVLVLEKDQAIADIALSENADKNFAKDRYEKIVRIFSFWSVYLSHVGLARYLSKEHSIRALERLAEKYEGNENKTSSGNIPFNFSIVHLAAKLYHSGKIDKLEIEKALKKYGENSSIFAILKVVIYIYSYYMPIDIEEKQWLSSKLGIPLRKMEVLHLKSLPKHSQNRLLGKPKP